MLRTRSAHLLLAVATLASGASAQVADLSHLVAELPEKHGVPAVGCAFVHARSLAGLGVAGVRQRGKPAAAEPGDLWHLGSCTKAMTATLMARLVQREEMAWETELSKAFDDIKVHEDYEGVVLKDLFTHRAGLMRDPTVDDLWVRLRRHDGEIEAARTMLAKEVLALRPAYEPGAATQYSNTGYMLGGAAIERALGTSWERAIRTHVFAPLGMDSAGFGPPGLGDKALPQPWGHSEDGTPIRPGPNADNPKALGPAGTVHATLEDWARFAIAHLPNPDSEQPDDERFLRAESMRVLHTPVGRQKDYACGWGVATREWAGGTVLLHSGSNTMWFCVCWLSPGKGMALLATCNQGGDAAARACDAACVAMIQHAETLAKQDTEPRRKGR